MLKFFSGFGFGAILVGGLLAFGPKEVSVKIRATAATAEEKVVEARQTYCRKEFLEETACFQNPKMTAEQCGSLIEQKCGRVKTGQ